MQRCPGQHLAWRRAVQMLENNLLTLYFKLHPFLFSFSSLPLPPTPVQFSFSSLPLLPLPFSVLSLSSTTPFQFFFSLPPSLNTFLLRRYLYSTPEAEIWIFSLLSNDGFGNSESNLFRLQVLNIKSFLSLSVKREGSLTTADFFPAISQKSWVSKDGWEGGRVWDETIYWKSL